MLVLSRKPDEKIRIGGDVTITVLSSSSKRVRLGIAAPPDVSVFRDELQPEPTASDSGENSADSAFQASAES